MSGWDDDAELVRRVRDAWGRPSLEATAQARFDARLRARLGAAERRWRLPALAGVVAVAATALVVTLWPEAESGSAPAATSWIDILVDAHAAVEVDAAWEAGSGEADAPDPFWGSSGSAAADAEGTSDAETVTEEGEGAGEGNGSATAASTNAGSEALPLDYQAIWTWLSLDA